MLPGLDYPGAGEEAAEQAYLQRAIRALGWGYAIERMLELALVRPIVVPNPAAGVDWSVAVPGGSVWEPLMVVGTFAASASVANRSHFLEATDNAVTVYRVPSNWVDTANLVTLGSWSYLLGSQFFTGGLLGAAASLPAVPLTGGQVLAPRTTNIQAGDQWSGVIVIVREWSAGKVARTMRYLTTDLESAGGFK